MKTDTKELAAGLRELSDLMLKGSGNALMHSAADRMEELEEQLAANHAATELMSKWLEDERELTDKLAAWCGTLLSKLAAERALADRLASALTDSAMWHAPPAYQAWKEARNDT
jgi:hypothetical protein